MPEGTLGATTPAVVTAGFEAVYRALYGRNPLGVAIEALNWRLVASGPDPSRWAPTGFRATGPRRPSPAPGPRGRDPHTSRRRADSSPLRCTTAIRSPGRDLRGAGHRGGTGVHHHHRTGSASARGRDADLGGGARLMSSRRSRAAPARGGVGGHHGPPARWPIATPACSRCCARASTCWTWAADQAPSPSRRPGGCCPVAWSGSTSTERCSRRPGRRARPARCRT